MSKLTDIADAVTAAINGATLPLAVSAIRRWMPERPLAGDGSISVDVIPRGVARVPHTREHAAQDCTILVSIQKRLGITDGSFVESEIDGLATLAEAIAELLDMSKMADAPFITSTLDPVAARDSLDEQHLFVSVLSVTYRAFP